MIAGAAAAFAGARARDPDVRRLWLIVIGTVPIVIVGALWSDAVDAVRTPLVAAIALVVGSVFLLVVERLRSASRAARSR